NNIGILSSTVPENIKVIDLNIKNKTKIVRNIVNVWKLIEIFNKNEFKCIVSVTRGMNLIASIARLLSMKTNIPLLGTIHNSVSQEKITFPKIKNYLTRKLNSQFSKVIVVSEEARKEYIKLTNIDPNNTITIYNPVVSSDIIKKSEIPCTHPWLKPERKFKTLITAGRLTYQKNQMLLLKMFLKLKEDIDVRLILLGEGELREELEIFCRKNNISKFVDFVGYVENPYSYFKNADAFILSSRYEGLPTVLIEALACGCNIVSTDCPTGPKEILEGNNYGFLSKLNDFEDLLLKTKNCLNNPISDIKLIKHSFNYSTEKSKEQYETILREVING
ncbi:glycosyltransferase, partial [Neobacillus drentensis]|uniref:glycosyltransferase n=1 Tax=Neobacillus drentensis TaxID=220684 RepID=UPI0030027C33